MTQTALTLTEAADACGVSRSTIKRRQAEFEHAYQDGAGVWRVPVSDLLGAGLKLRPSAPDAVDQGRDLPADPGELVQAQARIRALTDELAAERTARQVAEARAAAMRDHLDDMRLSLRALTGPERPSEPPARAAAPEPVPAAPEPALAPRRAAEPERARRGLWARIRG